MFLETGTLTTMKPALDYRIGKPRASRIPGVNALPPLRPANGPAANDHRESA